MSVHVSIKPIEELFAPSDILNYYKASSLSGADGDNVTTWVDEGSSLNNLIASGGSAKLSIDINGFKSLDFSKNTLTSYQYYSLNNFVQLDEETIIFCMNQDDIQALGVTVLGDRLGISSTVIRHSSSTQALLNYNNIGTPVNYSSGNVVVNINKGDSFIASSSKSLSNGLVRVSLNKKNSINNFGVTSLNKNPFKFLLGLYNNSIIMNEKYQVYEVLRIGRYITDKELADAIRSMAFRNGVKI